TVQPPLQRPLPRRRERHRREPLRDRPRATVLGRDLGRQPLARVGCDRRRDDAALERARVREPAQHAARRGLAAAGLSGYEREHGDADHRGGTLGTRAPGSLGRVTDERWTTVDRYLSDVLAPPDEALTAALEANAVAGLPAIDVSPTEGKLLHLIAR